MQHIKNIIYFLLIFLTSITFASKIFLTMDSDYLGYLAFAKNILNNEIIYKDFFSHKGPYFLLYLAILSKIISFGQIQSWIILSITLVFFYLSVLSLCNKFNSEKLFVFTIIFSIASSLRNLSTNLILDLYLATLIILSFLYIYNYYKTKNFTYLFISYLILSVLFFSRIDMAIYMVGLTLYLLIFDNKNLIKKIFLIFSTIFLSLFFLIFFFNIDLNNFLNQNLNFNLSYKKELFGTFLNHFVREQHFTILASSALLPVFIYIFYKKMSGLNIRKNLSNIDIIFAAIGIFLWFIIGSDKDYHVLILLCPILIFIIYNSHIYSEIDNKLKVVFLIISFYGFFLSLLPTYVLFKNHYKCISNTPCDISSNYDEYKIVEKYGKIQNSYIIGGKSYFYLLSNNFVSNPNNSWFYLMENFEHPKILENYNYILNNEKILFIVNKRLMHTKKVKKLIENSKKIDETEEYKIFLSNTYN